MNWEKAQKIFKECKELLGNPDVDLVHPERWLEVTDEDIGDNVGMSSDYFKIVTVVYNELSLSEFREVSIHEIAHIIFPNKRHWWIECYSSVVAKTRNWFCYHAEKYGHSKKELPKREKLIEMTIVKMEGNK